MKECETSPKQYINAMRVNKAKHLLLKTNMNITEIGNSVGYYDVLSFLKFFSVQTGMSPKNYRAENKSVIDS